MTTSTAFQKTLSSNNDPWAGYTLRVRIPASQISKPEATPTFIKVTMDGGTAKPTLIGSAYIGHASGNYSFASTPTPITVGSATSFTIAQSGQTVSDSLNFVYDGVSDILISAYFSGTSANDELRFLTSGGGSAVYYKAGNDTSTLNASGYAASSYNTNCMALVSKIEMDGYSESSYSDPLFDIVGVIRNSGSGWFLINNSDHKPMNITGVSTTNGSSSAGYVTITYPTASYVGSLLVAPDDTFSQSGYSAGVSANLGSAKIYFGHNGSAVSPNSIVNSDGNFWILGKMWN